VLVQDNLNTHAPASLYEAFPPPEARRLVERFEWHYTPKHGSWLDMAESELAILSGQCPSDVSPTAPPSNARSQPGSSGATHTTPRPTGASQPPTPASG
jgi:DDE superfamily endonuclease